MDWTGICHLVRCWRQIHALADTVRTANSDGSLTATFKNGDTTYCTGPRTVSTCTQASPLPLLHRPYSTSCARVLRCSPHRPLAPGSISVSEPAGQPCTSVLAARLPHGPAQIRRHAPLLCHLLVGTCICGRRVAERATLLVAKHWRRRWWWRRPQWRLDLLHHVGLAGWPTLLACLPARPLAR